MAALFQKFFNRSEEENQDKGEEELVERENYGEEDGELALDVYQDKDNVVVKSTIAGVKPEDLDINIASDSVTIKGQRRRSEEVSKEDYLYQECYWGSFERSFMLPMEIDVDKAKADLKDGVLTLVLPKASRSRTKKVKIKGTEE